MLLNIVPASQEFGYVTASIEIVGCEARGINEDQVFALVLLQGLSQGPAGFHNLKVDSENGCVPPELFGSRHAERVEGDQQRRFPCEEAVLYRQLGDGGGLSRTGRSDQRDRSGSIPRAAQLRIHAERVLDLDRKSGAYRRSGERRVGKESRSRG